MMTDATAVVLAAMIAAVGSITVAMIRSFRRENRRDHGIVMTQLSQIHRSVDRVDGKVDRHLGWHADRDAG
jgi:hypothetical protein